MEHNKELAAFHIAAFHKKERLRLRWRDLNHLRAACKQHANDLQEAARSGNREDIRKELVDMIVILELSFGDENLEILLDERRAKFEATADLPPLEWEKK